MDSIIYLSPTDSSGNSTKVDLIRQIIADKFHEVDVKNVIIIVAGKILKDDQSMTLLKINDGHTIHAVFKSVEYKKIVARDNDKYQINYTTKNTSHLPIRNTKNETSGALFEMDDNYGLTNSQMNDLIRQLMDNPELLARYIKNPMIEKMCTDQNVLNELINGNQFLKGKMDKSNAVKEAVRTTESIKPWMAKLRNAGELHKLKRLRKQNEDRIKFASQRIGDTQDDSMETDEELDNAQLMKKFAKELTELKSLGFMKDDNMREKNITLLSKYRGNVNSVVEHILKS